MIARLFIVARAACLAFVLLFGVAAAMYPGGSPFDRAHPGYDVADNYVCDTFRARAYDGRENPLGARIGQLGMFALVIAASASLLAAPSMFSERFPRLAAVARINATIAFFGMLAVPLTPAHEYGNLHFISVGVAAVPSLLATYLVAIGVVRTNPSASDRRFRAMTLVMVAVSTIHFAQYVSQAVFHVRENPWLPRVQKLVLVIDLAWLVWLGLRTTRPADAES